MKKKKEQKKKTSKRRRMRKGRKKLEKGYIRNNQLREKYKIQNPKP